MADVSNRLPTRIESRAVKRVFYDTEMVRTDGGSQHTNQRWSASLAEWDINIPAIRRNSTDYTGTISLFDAVKGSFYTFNFHDVETCADVEVRIKGDTISITGEGNLASISMTLEAAR